MTSRELQTVSGILEHLSTYALTLIEQNPKQVAELAANERLVRSVRNKSKRLEDLLPTDTRFKVSIVVPNIYK